MNKNEEKMQQVDRICARIYVGTVLGGAMIIAILLLVIIFIAPVIF